MGRDAILEAVTEVALIGWRPFESNWFECVAFLFSRWIIICSYLSPKDMLSLFNGFLTFSYFRMHNNFQTQFWLQQNFIAHKSNHAFSLT